MWFEFRDSGFGFRDSGFGFRDSGFGFRDSDSEFEVSGVPVDRRLIALAVAPLSFPREYHCSASDFSSGVPHS